MSCLPDGKVLAERGEVYRSGREKKSRIRGNEVGLGDRCVSNGWAADSGVGNSTGLVKRRNGRRQPKGTPQSGLQPTARRFGRYGFFFLLRQGRRPSLLV